MVLIGALVLLSGYTAVWAGREMLGGCKPSLSALLIPGRYRGCNEATGGPSVGEGSAGDRGSSGLAPDAGAGSGGGGNGGGGGSW